MKKEIMVVGGGIGGMAAALALARDGAQVQLLEQSAVFSEVGAGIQLGPNVTRVLHAWGLADGLRAVAAFPEQLQVRNALTAQTLCVMPLGVSMVRRYGAPYATIARTDMHSLLLNAVRATGSVDLQVACRITGIAEKGDSVEITTALDQTLDAPVLVGADGLWSKVRAHVLNDGGPRTTGHLAFRAMVPQSDLPERLRSQVITAWMGPDFHVVQYPVRGGRWLNVVAVVHGHVYGDPQHWDHSANAAELSARLAQAGTPLQDLVRAISSWRLWALSDRAPMRSAAEHARGRVALLGDAAHPMRPYLAQGAGMAIEDAAELALALQGDFDDVPAALQRYAQARWQRNAQVQARAIRNGEIFHMRGFMQFSRDLSLKLFGARLLALPWLYGGGPVAHQASAK
jgi:salicylate hydroxylase